MTAKQMADMANEFEKMAIGGMSDDMYDLYMALPKDKRAELILFAIKDTAEALK